MGGGDRRFCDRFGLRLDVGQPFLELLLVVSKIQKTGKSVPEGEELHHNHCHNDVEQDGHRERLRGPLDAHFAAESRARAETRPTRRTAGRRTIRAGGPAGGRL